MLSFKTERINYAILFFAQKHYIKTKKYLSQTALFKYLAFFEFRLLAKTGEMPLELQYKAIKYGTVPIEIYSNRDNPNYFNYVILKSVQYSNRQNGYSEKINRDSIRPNIPDSIPKGATFLAIRFTGFAPMIGFMENNVFHIVFIDTHFNVYDHGA